MGLITSFGPMQTPAPSLQDLRRRNETEEPKISMASDSICGYISGRPGASLACPDGDNCFFFPPASVQTLQHHRVICCGETSCQYYTECVNSEDYFSSTKCVDGCEVDNFVLKCTESDYQFCNTISFEGNTIDYSCNDVDITTKMSAALSYSGEEEKTFLTLNEEQYESLLSQLSEAEEGGTSEATATRTSEPSATDADNEGSGGSGNNTGAIVGGVVGGVAALALVAVAILLFMRLRKKKKAQAQAANNPPAYQPPPGGDWQQQQQQQQQTMSPNSGYSQPAAGFQPPQQQPAIHEAEAEVKDNKPQELGGSGPGKKEGPPVELA